MAGGNSDRRNVVGSLHRTKVLWLDADSSARSGPRSRAGMFCFAKGTLIETPLGMCAVEDLCPGHMVSTLDGGPQPVIRCGSAPDHAGYVSLPAHALAPGMPFQPLGLGPDHHVLTRLASAGMITVEEELVLVSSLYSLRPQSGGLDAARISCFFLVLPHMTILWANGAAVESYAPKTKSRAASGARGCGAVRSESGRKMSCAVKLLPRDAEGYNRG